MSAKRRRRPPLLEVETGGEGKGSGDGCFAVALLCSTAETVFTSEVSALRMFTELCLTMPTDREESQDFKGGRAKL